MPILHSGIEFQTNLEMSACKARLENAGASVWNVKNFITRRDTNRLGFLWYEKRGLKSLLLQGPALLGDVTPKDDYRLVKADFRPYLGWKWLLLMFVSSLILLLLRDFSAQRDTQISLYLLIGILVIAGLIQFGFYLMVRSGWKRLSARLMETLATDALQQPDENSNAFS